MTDCLITIVAAPSLEEALIDWLLTQEDISGFSTAEIYGHGSRTTNLSVLEQVTGRQKRIQLTTHACSAIAPAFIENLKRNFQGANLHYYITLLTESGQI